MVYTLQVYDTFHIPSATHHPVSPIFLQINTVLWCLLQGNINDTDLFNLQAPGALHRLYLIPLHIVL